MINYQYLCPRCKEFTEQEYAMGSAPQETECEHCNYIAHRFYSTFNVCVKNPTPAREGRGKG